MNNPTLASAKYYRDKMGWSVIPIVYGTKFPPKDFNVIQFRERYATDDELTEWFVNKKMNIGIVTGKLSNLFVVDLDKYKEEYKEEIALEFFGDNPACPIVSTPRGGEQLYFLYPEGDITIGSGLFPAIDFRGDKGYVVAPPSVNGNGKAYQWVNSPKVHVPSSINKAFISSIYNINNNSLYRDVTEKKKDLLQPVTLCLDEGQRDQSLFHVAHTMLKGGASPEETKKVLEILSLNCNPPFPKKEIEIKIKSALERFSRKERNMTKEVESFVAVTNGYFAVTDCYSALQAVTKEEKTAIRVALSRLNGKVIEKHGDKDGVYKRIDERLEFITFEEGDDAEEEYPIRLPLSLSEMVEIIQGNIILVAGEFNAGKTTFLLNILQMNKNRVPIRYISSEMKKNEFLKRFRGFKNVPADFWKPDEMTDYVLKSQDFQTAIKPDGLNIIDYLEFRGADFTLGAEYLAQIHDKLTTGVAIVAIQKKEGQRMPRSGDLVLRKAKTCYLNQQGQGER